MNHKEKKSKTEWLEDFGSKTMQLKYKEHLERYYEEKSNKKLDNAIAMTLATRNAQTDHFWSSVGIFLSQNTKLSFSTFFYTLLCSLANALMPDNAHPWFKLSASQKRNEVGNALKHLAKLKQSLRNIPKDGIPLHFPAGLSNHIYIERVLELTHWGRDELDVPIIVEHGLAIVAIENQLRAIERDLENPQSYRQLTKPPAKQSADLECSRFVQTMVRMFDIDGCKISNEIILDLCHIFNFVDVSEQLITDSRNRLKKLKNKPNSSASV